MPVVQTVLETVTNTYIYTHREREREKRREDNTLLHMDKDLSIIRLSCKSVADDKHSNNQYINQEYNELCGGENDLKTKLKLNF